jgi:hypothetical protein
MLKLSGTSAEAWWYDPRTGAANKIDGTFHTNHWQKFTPPSSGAGKDWVLVLDDKNRDFPSPGAS